ncbi:HK97-gp10 family putative phage morphogenesis protein [Tepidanaerobacter sp. EBM-38]|uniref:HK97-gp10 family putative phage morphogenesis protein n=1 Tax=Tepidanaerobacter sp. EBM-38 TaxID=1918496 RepID=UPI000A5823C7|nr:HK97-gp10 family putative phage morphogenesis protein [Tepidanaerobacter sp. EBM-38]
MANLELEGIENLIAEVEKLGAKGARIENKALREAGEVVREAIKQEAPRKTGTLKKSIEVSRVKNKDGAKYVEVGPGKEGWYGKFLEFGTVKMKAKPFMAPGYEKSKEKAMEEIEKN